MAQQKECFKTKIGGQAVLEGIAMRGKELTCLAVRVPDGTIHTEITPTKPNPLKKIPILRGAAAMILSLVAGYGYLMRAADLAFPEEKKEEKPKAEPKQMQKKDALVSKIEEIQEDEKGSADMVGIVSGVLGVALAAGLFILLPTFLTGLLAKVLPIEGFKSVIEGLIKIAVFITYLFAVTRVPDIHRVFEYHGAEHKTIACYEHRGELTPEGVRPFSRFHPRCGTSFLFIVLIISIIVSSFISWDNMLVRVLLKIASLPIIMGISYEIIQYSGAHDNALSRILAAPGLWVQRLTAFEPSDEQIEVAIASLLPVLPKNEEEAEWTAR